jgi:3-dehydroquinate dehydratase-2
MTRVEVMHGINLDQLGKRPVGHYGSFSLPELEERIAGWAEERGLAARFFRTNFEGAWVEHLHTIRGEADGLILNPGAWTHYAWGIRDALEIAGLPAVEVHLSDVMAREEWRRVSVIRDLCVGTVSGQGPEGYRAALDLLREHLH